MGTLLGGLLSASGNNVQFIRDAKAPPGAKRGVRIILPNGWLVARETRRTRAELNIVALARDRLRGLSRENFKTLADPRGCHTVFCNCDPQEPSRLGFADSSRSFMLTLMEAVKLQDREVELLSPAVFIVQKDSPLELFAGDFSRYGVSVQGVDDVVPYLDSFFVYQLIWLPAAMCNTTIGHFLSFPEGRELARNLLDEGLSAMRRAGREIAKLPIMDPGDLLLRLRRKADGFENERFAPDRSYPPSLQALLRGRQPEARELNNKAVEIAATAGLRLPWNWKVYQKAGRALSVGYYRSPAELLKSLG